MIVLRLENAIHWPPMPPKIECRQPDIKDWLPCVENFSSRLSQLSCGGDVSDYLILSFPYFSYREKPVRHISCHSLDGSPE